ncbi:MAG TPA: amidohydrolase family protein, partial [Gemmatimonadaceae bacterium]|nr:amidohydrolase family protein [Gemmatimonadaceae bacterium]
LSWSPDGREVVWSAGRGGAQDLHVTTIAGGATRRLTALRGSESQAAWSPDGEWISFVHWARPELPTPPWAGDTIGRRIRIVRAKLATPATLADTRELGRYEADIYTSGDLRPVWNDSSTAVLAFQAGWMPATGLPIRARWLSVDGRDRPAPALPYRPSFVHVGRGGAMTFVRGGQLWRVASAGAAPSQLGESAALYPSVADDGTVLFVSPDGLRLQGRDGSVRELGWPIPLRVAAAPAPMIVRNVRVFDGTDTGPRGLRDLSIHGGRIAAIAPAGSLPRRRGVAELDASGRWVIPGLIDAHVHYEDPAVLPAALYFGVTTVREMGGPTAAVAAARDAVMAGAIGGPRVLVSGPRFYPSPTTGGWTGSDEWMPADSATMVRGLELLRAFGATNVKLRYPQTFASGAMLARLARARGMSISGHCIALSLVVAGVGEQQHLDGQCIRNTSAAHDDRAQLFRAAGVVGVATIFLHAEHARAVRDTSSAHHPDIEPFLTPQLRLTRLADNPTGTPRGRFIQRDLARSGARWFHEMGLPLVMGSDAPDLPGAQHGELAELVSAGLTPAEALVTATSAAARALGVDADVGRIAVGKIADLVLLDADPLVDIANTRKIWRVVQGGRVVDRDALRSAAAAGR